MPNDTRTWSVPTSPRSPYKLKNELSLFGQFSGQVWNRETQTSFARLLAGSEGFEGSVPGADPTFSARDRMNRSPKTFGLVWQDPSTRIMAITDVGQRLLNDERIAELWTKQLLKWQYPSPVHNKRVYRERFRIKPFLECLRLIRDAGGVTKYELAVFGVPLIDYTNYDTVLDELLNFRRALSGTPTGLDRKRFKESFIKERFASIYREEIEGQRINIRERNGNEDPSEYIRKKKENAFDYADSAIRYFRSTELFTVSQNFKIQIRPNKIEVCEAILAHTDREPRDFRDNLDEYRAYFLDPERPALAVDHIVEAIEVYRTTAAQAERVGVAVSDDEIERITRSNDLLSTKHAIERLETKIREKEGQKYYLGLRNNYEHLTAILDLNKRIQDRTDSEILDRALYFEWNLWRLFSVLNHGDIVNNGKIDAEGQPISDAQGNMPDALAEYPEWTLTLEATTTSGQRQYDSEGESIIRHLGVIQKKRADEGDNRPIFGIFVAPKISDATYAHLFNTKRTRLALYGGAVRILPVDLSDLEIFAERCASEGGFVPARFLSIVQNLFSGDFPDEVDWKLAIQRAFRG